MSTERTLARLEAARLIAVLRVDAGKQIGPAIGALHAAGLVAVEVTWTSPDPARQLAAARRAYGEELLLGAGTLRTQHDVNAAVASGADFLVTPHLDVRLLEPMLSSGRLVLPGVFTPSEVAAALDAGATGVKLFPASVGGIAHLTALRGPFPDLRIVPTGGVSLANAAGWLAAGALAVGVGGELCRRDLIAAGRWHELTQLACRFLAAVGHGARPDRGAQGT